MAARGVKVKTKKAPAKGTSGAGPSLPSPVAAAKSGAPNAGSRKPTTRIPKASAGKAAAGERLANLKQALEAIFDRFNLGQVERHANYATDKGLLEEAASRLRRWRLAHGTFLKATVPLRDLTKDGVWLLASYAAALEAENRRLTNIINGDLLGGYGDLVKSIYAQAKPKGSKPQSETESRARREASKASYEKDRARRKCIGMIERELREAIDAPSARSSFQIGMPKQPPFRCLDDLLKDGKVRLATGSNNLCDLFGMGRKSLPLSGRGIKDGRIVEFYCRDVMQVAGELLDSGKWLAAPGLRRAFLMKLSAQTKRIAAPQHIAHAVTEFIKERLRRIRDSKA